MAVELDEADYNSLIAAKKLLEQLNGDPKSRKHLTAGIKQHYPNVRTDEDVAEEVARPHVEKVEVGLSRMEEMLAKLAERDAKAEEQRTLSSLDASFSRLKRSYGYNDEGIDKIKALMVDRSIPDPDAAAALFERLNPAPVQTRSSWEPDSWNLRDDAVETDVQGLFADPDRWADKEVGKILLDIRSQNES